MTMWAKRNKNGAGWQDRMILAAGVWLLVSPFALGTPSLTHPATVAAYVSAAVLVGSAAQAPDVPDLVQEFVVIAVALGLMLSPWLLDYSAQRNLTVNAVVVAALVAACAVAGLVRRWLVTRRTR